jgi:hypothetical protein
MSALENKSKNGPPLPKTTPRGKATPEVFRLRHPPVFPLAKAPQRFIFADVGVADFVFLAEARRRCKMTALDGAESFGSSGWR